ncbi:LexA/Signal peptidase [Peniophora sp. CONT]|nr:LexA/Signal peptidase [Peniophora sp. CONT]
MFFARAREAIRARPALRRAATALFFAPIPFTATYYYTVKQVNGISMQPTLNPDLSVQRDLVLFDRFSVAGLHQYERGDIVMVRSPFDAGNFLIKRLVALEGDTVKTLPPYPKKQVTIPLGHCWIEGDRSMDSEDSNSIGPIPVALVEAKMVSILLPFDRAFAWLRGDAHQRQVKLSERVQHERVIRARPGVEPPSLSNATQRVNPSDR